MTESSPSHPQKRIRSFVRRQGRLTAGQERALETLWPQFGVEADQQRIDFPVLFGRDAPVTLEIGFGSGDSLAEMAKAAPERDFLGIEVHRPGVGHCLQCIEDDALSNLRLMCFDAVEVLEQQIPANSLDRVQLFFPDPWHKKKHHKRRILRDEFVLLIRERLKTGGEFHMATDWRHYAEQMLAIMNGAVGFTNTAPDNTYVPRPDYRPLTKFERRGQRLGHGVWDLVYRKM